LAKFTGIEKPMPLHPPLCEKIAELIPTSAPRASMSGPLELVRRRPVTVSASRVGLWGMI
jgi:hypothetical protein